MCWKNLQSRAGKLGFDLEFRVRCTGNGALLPDFTGAADDWTLVGNYENAASIYVRPVTTEARQLSQPAMAACIARCDPFVEPIGDYDAEFFAAAAPFSAAVKNQAVGLMPA